MNSRPGTLTGAGIRKLPADRVDGMLRRIKETGSGVKRQVKSVRYRISGFRNPDNGEWIQRNPRNGHYYMVRAGRHRTQVRPTADMIGRSDMIALEVEVDRGRGNQRVYYVSVPGIR